MTEPRNMNSNKDPKKERISTLNRMLEQEYVLVHIDPNYDGVLIPDYLTKSATVTLKLSRLFIGGIDLNDDEIVTDLLFGDTYFSCHIPYMAIWGVTSVDGNNMVWPENTPKEVLKNMLAPDAPEPQPQSEATPKQKGHLKRVK